MSGNGVVVADLHSALNKLPIGMRPAQPDNYVLVIISSQDDNMPLILNAQGLSTPVLMLTLHSRVTLPSFSQSTWHAMDMA